MFEISWSELLILGIVTLIFVGPKELPVFLRTIGRYAGTIKRQATEFRAQFDAAMREAELDSMREEMEAMQASVNAEVMSAKSTLEETAGASTITPSDAALSAVTPERVPAAVSASDYMPMPPMPAPPSMER